MSESQAKRIRVQKGLPMSEPTVEEVRTALELLNEAAAIVLPLEPDHDALIVVFDAARRFVDAAEPDIIAARDKITPMIADMLDSRGTIECAVVAQVAITAAFGDNTLIRRAE